MGYVVYCRGREIEKGFKVGVGVMIEIGYASGVVVRVAGDGRLYEMVVDAVAKGGGAIFDVRSDNGENVMITTKDVQFVKLASMKSSKK